MGHRSKQKFYITGMDIVDVGTGGGNDLDSWVRITDSTTDRLKIPLDCVITNLSVIYWQDSPFDAADHFIHTFLLTNQYSPDQVTYNGDNISPYPSQVGNTQLYDSHDFGDIASDEGFIFIRPNNSKDYEFTTLFYVDTTEEKFHLVRSWEFDMFVKAGEELQLYTNLKGHDNGATTTTTGDIAYFFALELEPICYNKGGRR